MAAGRHGAYHDVEFRERGFDYDASRRDVTCSRDSSDRIGNGSRMRSRDVRDRERCRIRQKDIKERESVNGGYRSSSSRSNSGASGGGGGGGPRRCEFSAGIADREPGELSSESGSDAAVESESKSQAKVSVMLKMNGIPSSPVSRKRKFSPIVWDRDDKDAKDSSKRRAKSTEAARPPFSESSRQLSHVISEENRHMSPVKDGKPQELQASTAKAPMEGRLEENTAPESPADLHYLSPHQQQRNDVEVELLEEEDYIPTRNISSSRWAGDATSPADEGEISDGDDVRMRRKNMRSSDILDSRMNEKSSSPELGEVKRDLSDGARTRSSDSDGGIRSRPSTGDCGIDKDRDREVRMEVDDKYDNSDISISPSDTDSDDEHDSCYTPEPSAPKRTLNMLQGCRSVDEFERLNRIDEGTYGVVYRARDKKTGEIVALKKVKMEKEREGFPLTSLREINILLSLNHPSIVNVKEVVVGSSLDSIFMVMEYMEHDLKGLIETMKQPFSQSEVKCLMLQLLEGIKYLHDNWVLHRDLKTSNLLMNNQAEVKICDFGLARQYGSPLKPYTHLVVTLWYRAPELLLGAKEYSTAIDMWSLGCIMAELLSKEPLFKGKSEFDQLDKIFRILGTPNETIWPGFSKLPGVKVNFVKHQYNQLRKKFPATSFTGSPVLSDAGFDLLNRLLTYDPEKRITADTALKHEWFCEVPLPKSKEFMPTFPAQHAQDRRMRRVLKSPDPLEEQRRKELQQAELGSVGLFG